MRYIILFMLSFIVGVITTITFFSPSIDIDKIIIVKDIKYDTYIKKYVYSTDMYYNFRSDSLYAVGDTIKLR